MSSVSQPIVRGPPEASQSSSWGSAGRSVNSDFLENVYIGIHPIIKHIISGRNPDPENHGSEKVGRMYTSIFVSEGSLVYKVPAYLSEESGARYMVPRADLGRPTP